MNNVSPITARHNKSLLQTKFAKYGSNCRMKYTSPLQNQCKTPNVISRTDVENEVNDETKVFRTGCNNFYETVWKS